ncbi:MAG TPA: hypothetical protein VKD08_01285 [Ignavibacteriaceae bacterium]|nr:hypothetical protein [Ignavibacteriaceae bacterium]
MKRDEKKTQDTENKGFSEKEFMEYLEERFRKLKLDEQKFREEVLAKNSYLERNSDYTKLNG